jgi:hypothetical protein
MWRTLSVLCVLAGTCAAYSAPPNVVLGDFLLQRTIQQQLYYSAQLRNEPMVGWLKKFQGHEHLDSTARSEGNAGFPGSYSSTFSQLETTPYSKYLSALGSEPDTTIEVKITKPAKRLSARERANPYLAKQGPQVEIYNEPIIPKNILSQVLNTADAMVETWVFHLGEQEKNDLRRVASDREATKTLPTSEMMRSILLEKGGETAYSFFTQDEPMPLYGFDCRACDRLTTLRALSMLVAEVNALTPENAFTEASYLRREADGSGDDDDNINELIVKRRRERRESFEAAFVTGDDLSKAQAAREAALFFLYDFCDTWVPKLVKGDPRSDLQKNAYKPPPGMKEVWEGGVDSEKVFEALWEYQDEAAYEIAGGGELVFPALMGVRLRELRSAAAAAARLELQGEIRSELRSARLTYTDYTEEDDDGRTMSERFMSAADEESYVHSDIIREMGYGG